MGLARDSQWGAPSQQHQAKQRYKDYATEPEWFVAQREPWHLCVGGGADVHLALGQEAVCHKEGRPTQAGARLETSAVFVPFLGNPPEITQFITLSEILTGNT